MAKKKRTASRSQGGTTPDADRSAGELANEPVENPDDESADTTDNVESIEIDVALDDTGEDVDNEVLDIDPAPNQRLATKRRLDAYLERKWFRENGWDDDDDLFSDEFFDELEQNQN